MVISSDLLLHFASDLAREEGIQVCFKGSVKGGLMTGAAATLGGILLGPIGLAIGGVLGGVTAAAKCGSFKPLSEVILNDFTPDQKANLVNRLREFMDRIEAKDIINLAILLKSANYQTLMLELIKEAASNSGYSIQ